MISVRVDDLFVAGRLDTLENMKYMVKLKFNTQESNKVKNFLGVYYEWGHDAKGPYAKTTMKKYVKKLVDRSDIKVQKTPGVPGTTLFNIELKEPTYIDKCRSLLDQIMCYATNVGPDMTNIARELAIHMSYPGPEHWKSLGLLTGYLEVKYIKGVIIIKPKVLNVVICVTQNIPQTKKP